MSRRLVSAVVAVLVSLPVAGLAQTPDQPPVQSAPPAWREVPLDPGVFRQHATARRADTVDVVVPGNGEIEYMVRAKGGDVFVYSWEAINLDDPDRLTSEFHGHTDRAPGTTGTLVFYRKATGGREQGSLVAPFDGIHGWYFKNDSDKPVTIRVTTAGFYEPEESAR